MNPKSIKGMPDEKDQMIINQMYHYYLRRLGLVETAEIIQAANYYSYDWMYYG